jgi:MYXO-CTERM domain-containing protein
MRLGWLFAVACCTTVAAGSIVSTFDSDVDGWYLTDVNPSTFLPSGVFAATWGASFGNGGGGLLTADVSSWTWAANTTKFSGNWSYYLGGTVSYDIFIDPGRDLTPYPLLAIAGVGQVIYTQGIAPDPGVWTTKSHSLGPGDWIYYNGSTNTPATQSDIEAVLANVIGVFIDVDVLTGLDAHRLDNVSVVPEPSLLAALGMGALALRRRR